LLLFGRRVGASGCAGRCDHHLAERMHAMNAPFRVGLSGDFRKADGSAVYPDFDLKPLLGTPGVEMA